MHRIQRIYFVTTKINYMMIKEKKKEIRKTSLTGTFDNERALIKLKEIHYYMRYADSSEHIFTYHK